MKVLALLSGRVKLRGKYAVRVLVQPLGSSRPREEWLVFRSRSVCDDWLAKQKGASSS